MPLEINIKVCELGTIAVQAVGSNELARDYGSDVVEIIAGKLDEMALLACNCGLCENKQHDREAGK